MAGSEMSRRLFLRGGIIGTSVALRKRKVVWAFSSAKTAPPCGIPQPRSLDYSCEVLVAGEGPSGIGAAIGAAKAGESALVVEQHGFLVGMAKSLHAVFRAKKVGYGAGSGPFLGSGQTAVCPDLLKS